MPYCIAKNCKNTSANLKTNTGLSFHRFPREAVMRKKWIKSLSKNRKDDSWFPSNYSVLCSAHFEESDLYTTNTGLRRLHKHAVPTKNLFSTGEICTDHTSSDHSQYSPGTTSPTNIKSVFLTQSRLPSTTLAPDTSVEDNSLNHIIKDSDSGSSSDTPHVIHIRKELRKQKLKKISTTKKLKYLQQKIRRLKKKNSSLNSILKDLKHNILNETDTHRKLTQNVVSTELFHNLYTHCKGSEKLKISPAFKKFCLTLEHYSPKAYDYVRKSFNKCLPHRETLAKWYTHVKKEPESEES